VAGAESKHAVVKSAGGASVGVMIDRTYKVYIGGKQLRPDGCYSRVVMSSDGKQVAEVAEGNRKVRLCVGDAMCACS
jgi:aldehyde dehydrogenase (NAD+)